MSSAPSDTVLSKAHFLKLERAAHKASKLQSSVLIRYNIKNHFNVRVLSVEQKPSVDDNYSSTGNDDLQICVVDTVRAKKGKTSSGILFFWNQKAYDTDRKICTLTSLSGEILSRIVSAKDTGLSTCNYELVDNANHVLFQVHGKCFETSYEFDVKPPSEDMAVARILLENASASLSMKPELDSLTKIRLLGLLITVITSYSEEESHD